LLSPVFRHSKPFNPLLGETFEYVRPDLGYYCITEQVSMSTYTQYNVSCLEHCITMGIILLHFYGQYWSKNYSGDCQVAIKGY